MAEFWEAAFQNNQMMWGEGPAQSANFAKDYFFKQKVKNVLIPGIGYGRNALPFLEAGMEVTGIEISQTAIELARNKLQLNFPIYHGSVTGMPFDNKYYDGIFCYALIHLLDEDQRKKLINDCYNQLENGGYMIFTAISTKSPTFGTGTPIGKNRFEMFGGVQMFFYDDTSIREEFGEYGLIEFIEKDEPINSRDNSRLLPFFRIICRKNH